MMRTKLTTTTTMADDVSKAALVSTFNSLEAAREYIKGVEIMQCTKYVLVARTKNCRVTRVESLKGKVIKFEDTRGEVPLLYDGVPYILVGTEVLECQYGRSRKKKDKEQDKEDHSYTPKKKRPNQNTKKMGCRAEIKLRMIIKFPQYKLQESDKHFKRRDVRDILKKIQDSFSETDIQEYRVLLRFCNGHTGHVLGEEAGSRQPLDKRITQKIRQLVLEDGMRDASDIQDVLNIYRKMMPECPKSNRRFNPKLKDIKSHIHSALRYDEYKKKNLLPKAEHVSSSENTPVSFHNSLSENTPVSIHNNSRTPYDHNTKRQRKAVPQDGLKIESGYSASGDEIVIDSACTCSAFRKTQCTCKNTLPVSDDYQSDYADLPYFEEDDEEPVEPAGPSITEATGQKKEVKEKVLELVKEIGDNVRCLDDDAIMWELYDGLSDLVKKTRSKIRTTEWLRSRKRKRRSGFTRNATETVGAVVVEEDELCKVLSDIWNTGPSEDPVVLVGPYLMKNSSFHYIKSSLSDEVIDASLYILCEHCEQNVKCVSSRVMTAIFTGKRDLHGLLNKENILQYDFVVGAVNEGSHHWRLVIIVPNEKKVLYMNPLSELEGSQQLQLMVYWYNFLHYRFQEGIDTDDPVGWMLATPPHAKQADSTSCGIYVIQLVENFLTGVSMEFTWSSRDVHLARRKVARRLLAEGGPPSGFQEEAGADDSVLMETDQSLQDIIDNSQEGISSHAEPNLIGT